MLDYPQAALWGNRCRTVVIGEKGHVIVRSVEVSMVEDVERVCFEPELKPLFDLELLRQVHVEAYLEWTAKTVSAGVSKQRFEVVASSRVASRNAVCTWSHELGCEVGGIELADLRGDPLAICAWM